MVMHRGRRRRHNERQPQSWSGSSNRIQPWPSSSSCFWFRAIAIIVVAATRLVAAWTIRSRSASLTLPLSRLNGAITTPHPGGSLSSSSSSRATNGRVSVRLIPGVMKIRQQSGDPSALRAVTVSSSLSSSSSPMKQHEQSPNHHHLDDDAETSPYGRNGSRPVSSSSSRSASTTTAATAAAVEDARGAALLLDQITIFRGSTAILKHVSWRIEPRTKWALVGANGAGKSTLLQAIVGQLVLDSGKIITGISSSSSSSEQPQIGYLRQTAVAGSRRSVYDEAASGMMRIQQARLDMDHATATENWDALHQATLQFEAVGGYQQEKQVTKVLKGLGFGDHNLHELHCHELSGGWQMRVALARLLLSEPSLCLLDEPSNHLDAAAKEWLAGYLANYQGDGAMILVTHDVQLLQSMDHIAEIIPGAASLQIYKSCNYQQYLQLKQERADAAVTEYERNQQKAAQLQKFVDRFGASATKASAAQSRVKQIDKMRDEGLLDAPAEAVVAERFRPTLRLPDPPKAIGEVLLRLQDAAIGFKEGAPLISGVDLEIVKGMKLLIRGPNGAGKSTVLHALRGTLPLQAGVRTENPLLRLGMFTQDLAQELDATETAVNVAVQYARQGVDGDVTISNEQARNVLGRLGLQGDKALRRLSDLSGGEKARVALARLALKASNVYLLDEVSNHLDVECVDALSEAVQNWGQKDGAVVVVSHDQNFCDKIPFTHVATVRNGHLRIEERNARPSDWILESLSSATRGINGDTDTTANIATAARQMQDPALRKRAYNAPKRIAKLEQLIETTESQISSVQDEMFSNGHDVGKLVDQAKRKEALEGQLFKYTTEWEELELLLAEFSSQER